MARKRSPLEIRKQDLDYRWECRKRDPRFLEDYGNYKEGHLREIDLCNKWGLDFVPDDLNGTANPLGDSDVPVRLIEKLTGGDTATLAVTSDSQPFLRAQWDQSSEHYQILRNQRAPYKQSSIKVPEKEQRWVVVLDPHRPLRLILQGIEWLPWKKKANAERAKKNIDIRFAVYDRYQETEESFSSIAAALNKSISVVVAAYSQVYQDIHGEPPSRKKKLRRLKGFNSQTHFKTCRICKKAKTRVEEFCLQARNFVDQDKMYLREKVLNPPE